MTTVTAFVNALGSCHRVYERHRVVLHRTSINIDLPTIILDGTTILLLIRILRTTVLTFNFISVIRIPRGRLLLRASVRVFVAILLAVFSSDYVNLLVSTLFADNRDTVLTILILVVKRIIFDGVVFAIANTTTAVSGVVIYH